MRASMSVPLLHAWNVDPDQAVRIQLELRQRLVLSWDGRTVSTVAGIGAEVQGERVRAAIAVMSYPQLERIQAAVAEAGATFPYVSGLLAFREGPAILAAWEQLEGQPDLLLFHGHGIAHPRGCGLASHLGLWLDRPSIGVAMTRLWGKHAPPGARRGDCAELLDEQDSARVIGAVVRTQDGIRPLYVSAGHRIDSLRAVTFVLGCCVDSRIPAPLRWARQVASKREM
jgi:deoxyribonuclease V